MNEEINVVKLEWNIAMRTRPGMYIGDIDTPYVLLREAIDNSIDELYGSEKTNSINISTKEYDGWNVVSDNGRGIPIKWDPKYKMTSTQLAVTSTHTGSKFNKTEVAIGLNGVGISATNALSERFVMLSIITESNHDKSIPECRNMIGKYYFIEFSKGVKLDEGVIDYDAVLPKFGFSFPSNMSTITAFRPDPTIFKNLDCNIPKKNLAYVLIIFSKIRKRAISIVVNGSEIKDEFTPYKHEFVTKVDAHDVNGYKKSAMFYINFEIDNNMRTSESSGSVNSLVCNRGVHIDAANSAYQTALKSTYSLNYTNVMCGIRINTVVVATEVDFSSQTKERCTKIEGIWYTELAKGLVSSFRKIIKENKDEFDAHIERLNEYIASITKISTINKIKNAISTVGSGGIRDRSKLSKTVRDAASNNRKETELFICEGKSAAGHILNTRNPRTQAVFELRGVPANAIDKSIDDIFDNEEMHALIVAIGVGVNEYYEMRSARYGKIIIAADADPDGLRIASMVLGLIASKMSMLIKAGMVYVLDSPLYIQPQKDGSELYIYPGEEDKLDRLKPYTRIKGLGELREDQAENIITNADTRRLIQINLENVEDALKILTYTAWRKQLMIDKEVVVDPYQLGLWY